MGASALVENIIERALEEASKEYKTELQWYDDKGVLPFEEKDLAVQVLFIGGGNAYVLFKDHHFTTFYKKITHKALSDV